MTDVLRRLARRLPTLVLAGAAALASGCGKPFNESIDLVGTTALPALSDAPAATELRAEPCLSAGLDRRSWPPVRVVQPTHQVANYPTYVKSFRWDADRGPWSPAYPDVVDSVSDPTDAGQDAADAAFQPIWAAGLLVWAPIDMILGNWPWTRDRSPAENYERVPDTPGPDVFAWFELPPRAPELAPRVPAPEPAPAPDGADQETPTGGEPR